MPSRATRSRKSIHALVVLLLSTIPLHASAQPEYRGTQSPETDYASPGLFLLLGAATGIETRFADELAGVEIGASTGFNGRFGYMGGPIGMEAQLEYLPSFDATAPAAAVGKIFDYSLLVCTANARLQGTFGRLQPYVLMGVGFSYASLDAPIVGITDLSGTDFALRGGGGLNVWLTEHAALSVDASYVWTGAESNEFLDYVSIGYGILYKF